MEPVLERVHEIVRQALGPSARVYLYGSWASGRPGRGSDIDLGVQGAGGALAGLRERLEESDVPYPVEVVDLDASDEAFRRKVVEEGVEWTA